MIDIFTNASSRLWLIAPDALTAILDIADRAGDPEALATRLGRPLDNMRTVERRGNVAVVPVTGPIFRYANLFTAISGATSTQVLATDIQAALDDPSVKGIVLDVNSPGGEATGINELAQMIYAARGKKPITAYVGGLGASAAYWVASAADRIVVDPTAVLGSIGVVTTVEDTTERDAKTGKRTYQIVSSNAPNKRPDPGTDAGRAQYQAVVDQLAEVFVNAVARNRGTKADNVVKNYGSGGVLVGRAAVAAGMADSLGSLESTIASATSRSGSMALHTSTQTAPTSAQWESATEAERQAAREFVSTKLQQVEASTHEQAEAKTGWDKTVAKHTREHEVRTATKSAPGGISPAWSRTVSKFNKAGA